MTLDTRILIKRPVAVRDVYDFCNRELLKVEEPQQAEWPPSHMPAEWIAEHYGSMQKLGNQIGQGLSAILEVSYMPDGPITADYMAGTYDENDNNILTDEERDLLTGSMEVSFDTAYGYVRSSETGECQCGDLHAYFVYRLAQEFGPVVWLDECGGEWYPLDDPTDDEQLAPLVTKLGSIVLGANEVAATPFRSKTVSQPLV